MRSNAVMMTQEYLQQLSDELDKAGLYYGHGTDNSWDEACWLFETIQRRHGQDDMSPDMPVDPQSPAIQEIQSLAEQRIASKQPMAYLLKEAWFCGLCFVVDERVLVPRSPIAELIDNNFEPLLSKQPQRILDLCAGSGCIGIACAMTFPEAEVVLADISPEALKVAQLNILKHGLQDRVSLVESDLFAALTGEFDLIISNPPYVGEDEYAQLPDEFIREPKLALVSDRNGLDIPRRILDQAAKFLSVDGSLFLETGMSWPQLDEECPDLPFTWIDFEHGGEGVCHLSQAELEAHTR